MNAEQQASTNQKPTDRRGWEGRLSAKMFRLTGTACRLTRMGNLEAARQVLAKAMAELDRHIEPAQVTHSAWRSAAR
jgi:hypothetical protein